VVLRAIAVALALFVKLGVRPSCVQLQMLLQRHLEVSGLAERIANGLALVADW